MYGRWHECRQRIAQVMPTTENVVVSEHAACKFHLRVLQAIRRGSCTFRFVDKPFASRHPQITFGDLKKTDEALHLWL
jgi:hypothetical protein